MTAYSGFCEEFFSLLWGGQQRTCFFLVGKGVFVTLATSLAFASAKYHHLK